MGAVPLILCLLPSLFAPVATAEPVGTTYALLIGITRYKAPELNLQYAAADATLISEFQRSPRGGVPSENILLLTDGEATSLKIRRGLQDLKRRSSKNDTIVILIAGRGTVELTGSRTAFILSYDSDPQDLKGTALAVGELQAFVAEQLQSVARVILFLDVCRSGSISASSTAGMSRSLEALGAAPGKLFGFLATTPNQVSIEGPGFGGGHGVFGYYLVKGMQGEADTNADGFVGADELVSYVAAQVQKATGRRQRPREFGTYEKEMRLSDLSKPGISLP